MSIEAMLLVAVTVYMIGDVLVARGERRPSEALRRGGLLLVFTAFGILCSAAARVLAL